MPTIQWERLPREKWAHVYPMREVVGATGRFSAILGYGCVRSDPCGRIIILCESRHRSPFRQTSWNGLTGSTPTDPLFWSGLH